MFTSFLLYISPPLAFHTFSNLLCLIYNVLDFNKESCIAAVSFLKILKYLVFTIKTVHVHC
jgi:hypothetical protein